MFINGCGESLDPEVDCGQSGLSITLVNQSETECGASSGAIEVTASGGFGQKKFRINEEPMQNSGIFTSLKPGNYVISVTDENQCSTEIQVQLFSGISYVESIQPIIEANCITSNCHDGSGNVDFRIFQNLKNNPADIKSRTQSGNMPKNSSLTQAEIDAIACWVDDGALNN